MTDLSSMVPAVVIIGPREIPVQVRAPRAEVLRFDTSAEFEKWRKRSSQSITAAVHQALAELNVDLDACSPRVQEVIAALCRRESIPSVKEMSADTSSRRSFYRSWSEDIGVSPAAFLERVRLHHLHAQRRMDIEDTVAQPGTPQYEKVVG